MRKEKSIEHAKSRILPLLPILIAAISLLVSIRSCYTSNKSLRISEQQYFDKFKTIWTSVYNKEKETIQIKPTNPNIIIQEATAYYPELISEIKWPIDPPDYKLYLTVPIVGIQKLVNRKAPSKSGYVQVLGNSKIPIIIESRYTFNGDNFYDLSLYTLEYYATIDEDSFSSPHIIINGLIFQERLDTQTDIKKILRELWSELDSAKIITH